MNNKKNRNRKDVLIASIVMVMIGVLLVAAGFLIYRSNAAKIEKSQKTIAVIDKIETHKKIHRGKLRIKHDVYVDFEYNDVDYNHYKLRYYDPSMYEGKELEIYVYEKSDGNIEVISESGDIPMLVILGIVGIICFSTGITGFIGHHKPKQNPQATT